MNTIKESDVIADNNRFLADELARGVKPETWKDLGYRVATVESGSIAMTSRFSEIETSETDGKQWTAEAEKAVENGWRSPAEADLMSGVQSDPPAEKPVAPKKKPVERQRTSRRLPWRTRMFADIGEAAAIHKPPTQ